MNIKKQKSEINSSLPTTKSKDDQNSKNSSVVRNSQKIKIT